MKFSIIMPMDDNRLSQFLVTKRIYDEFPEEKEFVIPTRTEKSIWLFMKDNDLTKDVRLIPYTIDTPFNPAKALNIGVRESKFDNLILTGPEVKPTTQVLEQLSKFEGQNVMCKTLDEDVEGNLSVLASSTYRNQTPQPYFLAMFQKADVEKINGWDEDFMIGHAWEDNDFGERWVRAGIPFIHRDDIQATHQYHPRGETSPGGDARNEALYNRNNSESVVRPKNGLVKE